MAVSTAQDFTVKYTYFEIAVEAGAGERRGSWRSSGWRGDGRHLQRSAGEGMAVRWVRFVEAEEGV